MKVQGKVTKKPLRIPPFRHSTGDILYGYPPVEFFECWGFEAAACKAVGNEPTVTPFCFAADKLWDWKNLILLGLGRHFVSYNCFRDFTSIEGMQSS